MRRRAVFGILKAIGDADRIVTDLVCAEIAPRDISVVVLASHEGLARSGLFRVLVGVGSFKAAGLGPIIGAGPAMVALSAQGSASSGLVTLGLASAESATYEAALARGSVVASVQSERESIFELAVLLFTANEAEHMVVTRESLLPRPRA